MAFFRGFPIRGDLELTSDGRDFVLVTGRTKIAQSIRTRAQIFLGSWRYDRDLGVPYFQEILQAGPSMEITRRRFYELLIGTPGVLSVPELNIRFDSAKQTVFVEFTVVDHGGDTLQDVLDFVAST